MRGKVGAVVCGVVYSGITPAYAGKSTLYSGIRRVVLGSPPRMRGKGFAHHPTPLSVGITPAYAGKSSFHHYILFYPGDHPRVCGEKQVKVVEYHNKRGSPPRMRGKVKVCNDMYGTQRITPAYAGKRTRHPRVELPQRDHPRVCGEKPPRHAEIAGRLGITPAYAGKSVV